MSSELFLRQLVDYVSANSALTLGTDLFCGLQPDSPDTCVAILEQPVDKNWSSMYSWQIQGLSRAFDFWDAHANAYIIFELFDDTGFELTDYRTMHSRGTLPPTYIGEDESKRKLISTRFMMYFKEV